MASLLYPRTVSILRQPATSGAGQVGYQGLEEPRQTTLFTGVGADIEFRSDGPRSDSKTPSTPLGRSLWTISLAPGSVATGQVQRNDVVTDDLGNSYLVYAVYPGLLTTQLWVEMQDN